MSNKITLEAKYFIQAQLTEALYHALPVSITSLFLVISVIAWQLSGVIHEKYLLSWYLTFCLILFCRVLILVWYRSTCSELRLRKYHYYLFVLGSSLSGLLLGIVGSLLMPEQIMHQAVVIILISGVVAGGVGSLNASFFASIIFIYLITFPMLIWQLIQILERKTIYIGIFATMSLFCVYSYIIVRRSHSMLIKHIELAYKYKSLLGRVSDSEKKYKEQATHDLLTGLYNHQFLNDYLEIEIHKAQRTKTNIALVMLDIDFFKHFNDTYGHLCGDEILQSLGNLLNKNSRKSDIACRYGGEEFVIIMPETPVEFAKSKAELLRETIEKMSIKNGSDIISITVSIGIASFPQHALNRIDLFQAADKAMYTAKHTGRNRIVVSP